MREVKSFFFLKKVRVLPERDSPLGLSGCVARLHALEPTLDLFLWFFQSSREATRSELGVQRDEVTGRTDEWALGHTEHRRARDLIWD